MTPRELINKLLDMPMDEEITLFLPEKHIDEYGIESTGYVFHITNVNLIDGIVFDDWRNKKESRYEIYNRINQQAKSTDGLHN